MENGGERTTAQLLGDARIALDCRWLGMGGAGRLTEFLLREFQRDPPAGAWTLWGRPGRIEPLRFADASVERADGDPRRVFGQREFAAVPPADAVVYMHQIRPLRPGTSVTFILDTIPVRHGGPRPLRLAKKGFLRAVGRLSTGVLTISEFSKACIVRDLGLSGDRVKVAPIPIDGERAVRVATLRASLPGERVLLYVGRFDHHKNLERLCRVFPGTRFAKDGGHLVLVGGWPGEVEAMRAWVATNEFRAIEVRPQCSENELDRLFATSRALVVPSLEEGFGLPAFEAAASGLPVAASRTGAMTELSPDDAVLFSPLDEDEMAEAIDVVTARPARPPRTADGAAFRAAFVDAIADALARRA